LSVITRKIFVAKIFVIEIQLRKFFTTKIWSHTVNLCVITIKPPLQKVSSLILTKSFNYKYSTSRKPIIEDNKQKITKEIEQKIPTGVMIFNKYTMARRDLPDKYALARGPTKNEPLITA